MLTKRLSLSANVRMETEGLTTPIPDQDVADLVWLFQHLRSRGFAVNIVSSIVPFQPALLRALPLDRLESFAVTFADGRLGPGNAWIALQPFKEIISRAANSLIRLSLPTECKPGTSDGPALLSRLTTAHIDCEYEDTTYCMPILQASPALDSLALTFCDDASELLVAQQILKGVGAKISKLELDICGSELGFPLWRGPNCRTAGLDLRAYHNIRHLNLGSVDGPAFHLFPPKLQSLKLQVMEFGVEEDGLDDGWQSASQHLLASLADHTWQTDLREIRIGMDDETSHRYFPLGSTNISARLHDTLTALCSSRGIHLTLHEYIVGDHKEENTDEGASEASIASLEKA